MSDKNCVYWSESEHLFVIKVLYSDDDMNKVYKRKVCACGVIVKSRAEITDNLKAFKVT